MFKLNLQMQLIRGIIHVRKTGPVRVELKHEMFLIIIMKAIIKVCVAV